MLQVVRAEKVDEKMGLFVYGHFHNILRLSDVLPNFPFTTSKMRHHNYL